MDAYKTPQQRMADARNRNKRTGKLFGLAWITMFLLSVGVGAIFVWGFIRLILHFT